MQGWSTHKHPIGLEVHGQLQMLLLCNSGGIHMLQKLLTRLSNLSTNYVRTQWEKFLNRLKNTHKKKWWLYILSAFAELENIWRSGIVLQLYTLYVDEFEQLKCLCIRFFFRGVADIEASDSRLARMELRRALSHRRGELSHSATASGVN